LLLPLPAVSPEPRQSRMLKMSKTESHPVSTSNHTRSRKTSTRRLLLFGILTSRSTTSRFQQTGMYENNNKIKPSSKGEEHSEEASRPIKDTHTHTHTVNTEQERSGEVIYLPRPRPPPTTTTTTTLFESGGIHSSHLPSMRPPCHAMPAIPTISSHLISSHPILSYPLTRPEICDRVQYCSVSSRQAGDLGTDNNKTLGRSYSNSNSNST
jgi:hypothetical protein